MKLWHHMEEKIKEPKVIVLTTDIQQTGMNMAGMNLMFTVRRAQMYV